MANRDTRYLEHAERVWPTVSDFEICQTNTTLLDATPNQTSARIFRYDRDLSGNALAAGQQFDNLSDTYEYDFGSAPAITSASDGRYNFSVCPTSFTGYTRRTHTDFNGSTGRYSGLHG